MKPSPAPRVAAGATGGRDMRVWLAALLAVGCSSPALLPESKAEAASSGAEAAPAAEKTEPPKAPAGDITAPPEKMIAKKVTLESVEKSLYVPFGGTYFRLWGGA